MRFVEETDGKSFVQVNDGSKKDEKEYASKGVAGTALGLGIAGTALWLLNGGLGNCGLFGRGCGASAAEVAISSNEQYLERKECEDMVALTNAMWQHVYNEQGQRFNDRQVINQEMFGIYSAMRNGFDVINAKHNQDAFDLYKYSRDSKDELAGEIGADVRLAKRAGLLHDIGKSVDQEMEGTHVQIGADLCRKYKESGIVINAVEAHHGDVEPESLIACIVQAADTISAARPGARRETLETYTNRLKQLEDISNSFKGVEKSFAIQAGREVRVMVIPEKVSDDDMILLARDIAKQVEDELKYPGQIKVNVIRESRVTDYAK